MAKSVRSKSLNKAKALRRAAVYKPVDDARLQRLSEKLKSLPSRSIQDDDVVMINQEATSLRGPPKFRNRQKKPIFSAYGISAKEIKF